MATTEEKPPVELSAKQRIRIPVQGANADKGIAQVHFALPKPAGQRLVVKRISDKFFRANWYREVAESKLGTLAVKSWEMVDSMFVQVDFSDNKCKIVDRTRRNTA